MAPHDVLQPWINLALYDIRYSIIMNIWYSHYMMFKYLYICLLLGQFSLWKYKSIFESSYFKKFWMSSYIASVLAHYVLWILDPEAKPVENHWSKSRFAQIKSSLKMYRADLNQMQANIWSSLIFEGCFAGSLWCIMISWVGFFPCW